MRALIAVASLGCAAALPTLPQAPPGVLSAHLRGTGEIDQWGTQHAGDYSEKGHFYNADGCEDCVYKAAQCGCQPAVEYFACLTMHCHSSKEAAFMDKCTTLANNCSSDIAIDCRGPQTVCKSKFSQLAEGGLGLTVTINKDNAFCGPWGKCLGTVIMDASVQNAPKPPPPVVTVASPAPAMPAAPSPATAPAPAVVPPPPIWLECGLPMSEKANIDKKADWKICQTQVVDGKASCKMPLFKELPAGDKKKSYCLLTDGKDGKRLTQPFWNAIINVHEVKNVRIEAKAEKADEKKESEKGKVEKAEAKEEKKAPAQKEVKAGPDDSSKLPWMVDKEKRAAAKKAEAAKDANLVKKTEEAKKEAKKVPEKDGKGEEGEPPWMEGKKNDKPAPSLQKALES